MDNDDHWRPRPRKPLWEFGSQASNQDDSGIMSDEESGSNDQPSGVTRYIGGVKSLEAARRPLQPARFFPVILAIATCAFVTITMIDLSYLDRESTEPFNLEQSMERKFVFKLASGTFFLRSTISRVFTNQESIDTEMIVLNPTTVGSALKTEVCTFVFSL